MVREGQQLVQQLKFLLRKDLGIIVNCDGQIDIVQAHMVKFQLLFIDDLCSTKQCFHAKQQFIDINGFYHIVINAQLKALGFVRECITGCNHKDRQLIPTVSECFGKIISVHVRHHQIGDDQINIHLIQQSQCFFAVCGRSSLITILI